MAQVRMAALVAAAALAAAEPPPAVPQAAGSGGPTSRRDFYWLRSFLAGGRCSPLGSWSWVVKPAAGQSEPAAAVTVPGFCCSAQPGLYFSRCSRG